MIKGLMATMGMPVGSSRPPSRPLNQEEMDELRGGHANGSRPEAVQRLVAATRAWVYR